MNFIKRALLYCYRQKAKTLILFLVLSTISTFMLAGLAVYDASGSATQNVQSAIGGKLQLTIDTNNPDNYGTSQNAFGTTNTYKGDYIDFEMLEAISNVEGISGYNSEDPMGFFGRADNIKYLPAQMDMGTDIPTNYTTVLDSERSSLFENGTYTLIMGEHIKPEDKSVILISDLLAEYNNITVGDTIEFSIMGADYNWNIAVNFTVKGIYEGAEGTESGALFFNEIPANQGFVDYNTVFEDVYKHFDMESGIFTQMTFYVDNLANIQNVYDEIMELPEVKGKTLLLSIDTDEYEVVATPLESLQSLVGTIILIIAVVSVAILTLLLTLWIRGRKKEIGIYLSLGNSKLNIVGQFFTETIVVAIIAFMTSMLFSITVADVMSNMLLANAGAETSDFVVQISTSYLLPVYGIGVAIIAISVLISSWTIVNLKPRDILTKGN